LNLNTKQVLQRSLLLILLCLTGCGYHFNEESRVSSSEDVRNVSVPYIKGDSDGLLTAALIQALTTSGRFNCVRHDPDFVIDVAIVANNSEKIDYRYEHKDPKGKRIHRLVPVGTRRTIVAHVTLLNGLTNEIMMEPVAVKADADYDYVDYNSIRDLLTITPMGPQKTIRFSLGQLDAIEGAQDDVSAPLYRRLAEKIVEGVLQHD
jgi:hypothetical protein